MQFKIYTKLFHAITTAYANFKVFFREEECLL